ncbi:MAG: twin-arginine translocase subunit TatC [bacterium]|nr:twin-arginine translocase subunit TatC [bacterium]
MSEPARKNLLEHLEDLRLCLIRSAIALGLSTGLCLYFSKEIYRFLSLPFQKVLPEGSHFIAISPLEGVATYFKVSLLAGVFLASPFILYQLWLFIAPGLYAKERKFAALFVLIASFLFIGGASLGYFIAFPAGFFFFTKLLEGTGIQLMPQMDLYLDFAVRVLLGFGLAFLYPIILFTLVQIGLIQRELLVKARRYVIVLAFLVAGIATPGPDIISQAILALPLLLLYEITLLVIWLMKKS